MKIKTVIDPMKLTRLASTIALICGNLSSFSQETANSAIQQITIEGSIVNIQTSEAVPFASVSVKGHSIGTFSNADGGFVFNIPEEYHDGNLIVSCMGFDRVEIAIISLQPHSRLSIVLEPSTIELQEISVSEEMLTADLIIEKVIENIGTYYPTDLFVMKGYFREFKKVNSGYVSLKEVAISIYDKKGYGSNNRNHQDEKVIIEEIRKSQEFYKHWLNELKVFPSSYNEIAHLFVHNDLKYLKRVGLNQNRFHYSWDTTIYQNKKPVYLVSVVEHPERKFYVSENFYITQIVEHKYYDVEEADSNITMVGDSLVQNIKSWKNNLYFREIEGKYYPSYMSEAYEVSLNDPESGEIVYKTEYSSELLINDIMTEGVAYPTERDLIERGSLSDVNHTYNPDFWKNYNMIKLNPLDEKLMGDLERKVSLEEQFRANEDQ